MRRGGRVRRRVGVGGGGGVKKVVLGLIAFYFY